MEVRVLSADFELGIVDPAAREPGKYPEIAVAGRSNVGKSTFINYVLGKSGLARVSGKPGHTRQINIYGVTLGRGGKKERVVLADLPGFGFAKLSKKERENIGRMTIDYLRATPTLRAIALLIDSKRLPEEDEGAIVRVCAEHGVHVLTVLTKIDRLSQSERAASLKSIGKSVGLEQQDLLVSGEGKFNPQASFWSRVLPLLSADDE